MACRLYRTVENQHRLLYGNRWLVACNNVEAPSVALPVVNRCDLPLRQNFRRAGGDDRCPPCITAFQRIAALSLPISGSSYRIELRPSSPDDGLHSQPIVSSLLPVVATNSIDDSPPTKPELISQLPGCNNSATSSTDRLSDE